MRVGSPGPFLTPVLQGIESQIGQIGRLRMTVDTKNAAFFMKLVHGCIGKMEGIRAGLPFNPTGCR